MEIEIRRSGRKTMGLEITPDARVIVRAPYRVPEYEIRRLVEEKADWIEKHLAKVIERRKEQEGRERLSMEDIDRLAKQALEVIPRKAAHFAEIIGVTYGRITIRNQRSRWGSCSGKGNLNFNCLLMLMPEEVQDYVVVHELCHRREMNHSERFWKEVEAVLPDYRKARKWLKENGNGIIGSMTGEME